MFRNGSLGAFVAGAFLYPQSFVNMLLRPQVFFNGVYDNAIKTTMTQVEKPAWEEFKEKAVNAEVKAEQVVNDIKKEATEVAVTVQNQVEHAINDLKSVAEHVKEEIKKEEEHKA